MRVEQTLEITLGGGVPPTCRVVKEVRIPFTPPDEAQIFERLEALIKALREESGHMSG